MIKQMKAPKKLRKNQLASLHTLVSKVDKDAHCDAVITMDKSKIEHRFLLVHKVDKVKMNFQYTSLIFSIFFLT
jgi:hypothetical protein